MITDTSSSQFAKLHSPKLGDVQWIGGFWRERLDLCHQVMVPNMWDLLREPSISHAWQNFLIAAGDEEGQHRGPKWHDGDFYKWFEAAAYTYALTGNAELDRLMDEIINVLRRVQRADGYIHTPTLIAERQGNRAVQPFRERLDFETYNMGHLMTAACVHYRATGKDSLLTLACKAADYLYQFYQQAAPELARNAICPSHYMGVIELYRTTREVKYLELGRNLIEIRDLVIDGGDDNQDRIPFREQREAVGHAVRANYLYAGVTDVYLECGDETLLPPLEEIWRDVVTRKMYITGACGALYDGASPYGSPRQETITRVHQAYGHAFHLPNATAHNESCASIGNLLWNWRMFLRTGETRFIDIVELVLYNSLLAAISLDGKRFFYTNALSRVQDFPIELRWSRTREPYISCFCCPPNVVRTIAEVGAYAYSLSHGAIWVNLYGSSKLETEIPGIPDGRVRLRQETHYPWDGQIRIRLEEAPESEFALRLRIPGWAQGATLKLNGRMMDENVQPGTYREIRRVWTAGDWVELALPMPVELVQAHPLVEENRNQVAVRRGPLVYCLESNDLPTGVRPSDIMLPSDAEFELLEDARFGNLLQNPVLLRTQARRVRDSRNWSGQLYHPLKSVALEEVEIELIPYFAWDNRGKTEMNVWIPLVW